MQETVSELERSRKELEGHIARRDNERLSVNSKLEDEQALVGKVQKTIKEFQGRIEILEEELEAERQARSKAERQRADCAKELDHLNDRLNQACGATAAQVELNKKRDCEVVKLRRDLEESHIQRDATVAGMKKKQNDSVSEMNEQIDQLSKMKVKVDKDKDQIFKEINDVRGATDEVARSKASAEKSSKALNTQLNDINKKVEEANLNLADIENVKRRITTENGDLLHQLQELQNAANLLMKTKSALTAALEEQKCVANHEAKERVSLLGKYRNLEHEVDGLKQNMDEETGAKENVLHTLKKAHGEADTWRQKFEIEGMGKAEELEMSSLKLQAHLSESLALIEQLQTKLAQLEKVKTKLTSDCSEMGLQLDQAQILNQNMEKKAKQCDRIVNEWKHKVDGLGKDLDSAQNDTRCVSSELFKVKAAYEEIVLQLEEVRRENKALSNEIKDIMDQITEGGRSIHEIDKVRKRLEAEKLELQAALEEAEATLEQEENKVLRLQVELSQVRTEIERRLAEKDEEFLMVKKNQAKVLDSMQTALEAESKGKAEALRMRKKLESDAAELGLALEQAIAGNAETGATVKKYALQVRDAQAKVDEESALKSQAADAKVAADRKAAAMQNALEEGRALLETADRQRRTAEQELADTNETLADMSNQNQSIAAAKRKLENEFSQLQADLDEMAAEAKLSEDKAARAMVDAARLADELRAEQDLAMNLEKDKKLLEAQCKDAANRADEAEANALKGGRKAMIKMETRIRELESELDAEARRFADVSKNLRKSERAIKELAFAADEDKKNHERMQALIDQLQGKVKTYKKQIEEADEIEQALARMKARARSASLGPM